MFKKLTLPVMACVFALSALGTNQAYALNDDEAAVLVGLAVGGLAAIAVKHHREHDRRDWEYRERHRYERRGNDRGHYKGHYRANANNHRHDRHCNHTRQRSHKVEHYVIHNPPSHYHKQKSHYGKHHGYHKKHHRVGYEYEYEYIKRVRF